MIYWGHLSKKEMMKTEERNDNALHKRNGEDQDSHGVGRQSEYR